MKRFLVPLALFTLAACSSTSILDEVPLTTTTHPNPYVNTIEPIANPERGFYVHPGNCSQTTVAGEIGKTTPFSVSGLKSYNTTAETSKKMTLVLCIFYLPKKLDISTELLFFQKQADAVRAAGMKMILRFAYNTTSDDATYDMVKSHINQMADELHNNRDVIAVMESGFVGAWGEGDASINFGNPAVKGGISDKNWNERKDIVDRLMEILPSRMISVRTIRMKRNMYFAPRAGGTETTRVTPIPVSSSDAYGTKPIAQVGYYNDCFLKGVHDSDTYRRPLDPAPIYNQWNDDIITEDYPPHPITGDPVDYLLQDRNYLAADTKYVAMGGETCGKDPKGGEQWKGDNAVKDMKMFHFTYLNGVRFQEILSSWESTGHLSDMKNLLGYRFQLAAVHSPPSVALGSVFTVEFTIRNVGWAAPINSRPVYLVMTHHATGKKYRTKVNADARNWYAGGTFTVKHNISTSTTMPTGSYDLSLHLPDSAPALFFRPEYAIQLASFYKPSKLHQGYRLFQKSSGENELFLTVFLN